MIVVVETIRAIEGKKKELKKALKELVPISQKARGCLQYELFDSLDKGNTFLILMQWQTLEDLKNHEASTYIDEFVTSYEQILYDEVNVTEWAAIQESS